MLGQELLGVLPALPQFGFPIGVEGSRLLDDSRCDSQLQHVTGLADTVVEHYVKLSHSEGSRHLVFDYAGADPATDYFSSLLNGFDAPQVDSDRTVELQRSPTWCNLGTAINNPYLLPQLVDEYHGGSRVMNGGG